MAAGGWKAFRIRWLKGDGHYQTGTAQDVKNILNDIRTGILGTGIWEDDPDFVDGISGVQEPLLMDGTNLKWTHGVFFRNIVSGSKLMLTYTYAGGSFHTAKMGLDSSWTTDNWAGGLCCSVIPPGGGSFNPSQYAGRGLVPDAGTPVRSAFTAYRGNGTGSLLSAVREVNGRSTAEWCEYDFVCKDDVVGVFLRTSLLSSGAVAKGAYFGHIFDDALVPWPEMEPDATNANYGVVHLNGTGGTSEITANTGNGSGTGFCITGTGSFPTRTMTSTISIAGGVLRRRARLRTGVSDTDYYSVVGGDWVSFPACGIVCPMLETGTPVGTSGSALFSSVCITAAVSDNTENSGRYRFDGSDNPGAGVLRDDILLACKGNVWARGQTFGGQCYVYVGGGIAVGWDPSIGFGLFDN